jgi:hypothetical protein
MHLVGQLSNPSPSLKITLEVPRAKVNHGTQASQPAISQRRLGNGVVGRAITRVLTDADRPMRTGEIQVGVERLLRHPVSKQSVSW